MINITKTYLPPLEEYTCYLEKIWESHHVTNFGPLSEELENKLKQVLGVKHLFLVANGTIALQIAIKAAGLHGEVITTPFSYVATTSSLAWEGCRPVFADIHPKTLTINPDLIEAAITPRTTGILATHVYGYPCAVEQIQDIASRHNLKVIYDAAHAFGVNYNDTSLLNYGDIATLSFHATKLFHTGEGGALVTNNDELAHRISYMLNFGHKGEENFWGVGINGKISELHAAMGLAVLPHVPELINKRRDLCAYYDSSLQRTPLTRPKSPVNTQYNFAYYPVLFPSAEQLVKTVQRLHNVNVYPRRYFFPSLNKLNYVSSRIMDVSEEISARILCLPLSHYLTFEGIDMISHNILNQLN